MTKGDAIKESTQKKYMRRDELIDDHRDIHTSPSKNSDCDAKWKMVNGSHRKSPREEMMK